MLTFGSLPVPLLFYVLLQGIAAEQKCYGLNGTELDSSYGPCKPNAKHSGCCAIHRPAGSVDICLDNGLCMATNDEYMGTIWQDGCTDQTGKDAACPKMCPDASDGFNGGKRVLAWNIQMCDYGSYCCREVSDRSNCCNNVTSPKIKTNFLGAFQFATSTAALVSTTTTPTSPLTAIATTTPGPTQVLGTVVSPGIPFSSATDLPSMCKEEKQKTAGVVGGAVGGIMGAAMVSLLGVMFWMHGKEKRQRRLKEHYEQQFEQSYKYRPGPVTVVYEADSSELRSEKESEIVGSIQKDNKR